MVTRDEKEALFHYFDSRDNAEKLVLTEEWFQYIQDLILFDLTHDVFGEKPIDKQTDEIIAEFSEEVKNE